MGKHQGTESIRISQVMAGALAAVTAALLGSTMGVAGTVVGAGLASVVSTVGGALYLRSIQRTGQGVRTVRERVVARAGSTTVTVAAGELEGEANTAAGEPATGEAAIGDPAAGEAAVGDPATGEAAAGEAAAGESDEESEEPPSAKRLGWPAMITGSVLAFVLGMVVITGVEWLRGEPLSGGEGTTVGDIVRTHPDGAGDRDQTPPPATGESSTPPSTGGSTGTVTPTPAPTSEDQDQPAPPSDSSTTPPTTTTDGAPTDTTTVPPSGPTG